jgi:hypothetical protein
LQLLRRASLAPHQHHSREPARLRFKTSVTQPAGNPKTFALCGPEEHMPAR